MTLLVPGPQSAYDKMTNKYGAVDGMKIVRGKPNT
jgi:hypothetical protein